MGKRGYERLNQKNRVAPAGTFADNDLAKMIETVKYSGKSDHKKNPGDFGLTPPANHPQDKTLCEVANVVRRKDALALLKKGLKLGTIGVPDKNGWPKRIWAVAENDTVLEAQMDAVGSYHGYPLTPRDPVGKVVAEIWKGTE